MAQADRSQEDGERFSKVETLKTHAGPHHLAFAYAVPSVEKALPYLPQVMLPCLLRQRDLQKEEIHIFLGNFCIV